MAGVRLDMCIEPVKVTVPVKRALAVGAGTQRVASQHAPSAAALCDGPSRHHSVCDASHVVQEQPQKNTRLQKGVGQGFGARKFSYAEEKVQKLRSHFLNQ